MFAIFKLSLNFNPKVRKLLYQYISANFDLWKQCKLEFKAFAIVTLSLGEQDKENIHVLYSIVEDMAIALFPAIAAAVTALKTAAKSSPTDVIRALDNIASMISKERTQNVDFVNSVIADAYADEQGRGK